jgi:hypothetical protein
MTMTSRSKRQPLEPIREWVSLDGEEWLGLHPLFGALIELYAADERGLAALEKAGARLREIVHGERRLPDLVAGCMVALDAEQQKLGCPDENIDGLIELLRTTGA